MTRIVAGAALAVGGIFELSVILKATIVLGFTLIAMRVASRVRASVRHMVWTATFGTLLMLPVLALLLPPVAIEIPISNVSNISVSPVPFAVPVPLDRVDQTTSVSDYASTARSPRPSPSVSTVFRIGWALGVMLFLVPLAISLWRLRQVRRRGVAWPNGEPLVRMLTLDAGIRGPVPLLLHEDIVAPMTCGFVRPVIVLPADVDEWSDLEIRRAAVHELEHVRRADWPIHLITRFVCALYWFHPFVWIAWRQLRLESERACDDAVLCGAEQTAYAEQLVKLARCLLRPAAQHALGMASRSDLSTRIWAVLNVHQRRGRIGKVPAMVTAALAIMLSLTMGPLRAVGRSSGVRPIATLASTPMRLEPRVPQLSTIAPSTLVSVNEKSRTSNGGTTTSIGIVNSQAADPTPLAFEVAFVTPHADGRSGIHRGPMLSGDEFSALNFLVRNLIEYAYNTDQYHLLDGSSWISEKYVDLIAKAAPGSSVVQLRSMVRALLADRFHLVVHTETRDTPTYALVLATAADAVGPNLRPTTISCAEVRAQTARSGAAQFGNGGPCGITTSANALITGRVSVQGMPINLLTAIASRDAGRPVVDKTGLTGNFDIDLTWTPQVFLKGPFNRERFPAIDPNGPSIFLAVQEQLGLKLEPEDGPAEVLVIDHVDLPTP
jgi:uncharacterized protein (TIGR03435 family)